MSREICPVCEGYGAVSQMESEGVVLTGIEAMFTGDVDALRAVSEAMTLQDGARRDDAARPGALRTVRRGRVEPAGGDPEDKRVGQ